MQHDLQSHQQDRLLRIVHCLDIGSSKRLAVNYIQVPDKAGTRIMPKWLFSQVGLPPAIRMLYCSHLRKNQKETD
jgi:hypothetical protein